MSELNNNQLNPAGLPTEMELATEYKVETENYRPKSAGFWIRFWAYSIDLLVIYAISGLFIKPLFRIFDISVSSPMFLLFNTYKLTVLILFLAYFTLMTKYMQQTVGKMIIGIRVVPKDSQQLTWGTVFFRETVGRFISKILLFPYLLPVFMPNKEALHDLFADTYVIHENVYEKEMPVTYRKNAEQLQGSTAI